MTADLQVDEDVLALDPTDLGPSVLHAVGVEYGRAGQVQNGVDDVLGVTSAGSLAFGCIAMQALIETMWPDPLAVMCFTAAWAG